MAAIPLLTLVQQIWMEKPDQHSDLGCCDYQSNSLAIAPSDLNLSEVTRCSKVTTILTKLSKGYCCNKTVMII